MAKTNSNMIALGTLAPNFLLNDVVTQQAVSLSAAPQSKAYVVMFICNHCPYVKHIMDALVGVVKTYQKKGIFFVAINSNDIDKYPEDSPLHMIEFAKTHHFTFPYLFDETQEVAHAYQAACTPDFYIFNPNKELVYRGQMDSSRPGNEIIPDGTSIRSALDNLLQGREIDPKQYPSLGCNIKWKP